MSELSIEPVATELDAVADSKIVVFSTDPTMHRVIKLGNRRINNSQGQCGLTHSRRSEGTIDLPVRLTWR